MLENGMALRFCRLCLYTPVQACMILHHVLTACLVYNLALPGQKGEMITRDADAVIDRC